jgi:hypothetical protein
MADDLTLKDAVEDRGPYAVWDLMTEDERRAAATALWDNADRESRAAIELTLAKDLKFRAQSVRKLSAERVVGRLLRLAEEVPENVLFQFLFHLHMAERRAIMGEFLDAVGLPHTDGVLELEDDSPSPETALVQKAATALVATHAHQALVYLGTLKVADDEFWAGVDGVLEGYAEDGTELKMSD